ncbi:MAG: hypothetical protein QM765_14375 [Myxococcales bacterium]
MTTVLPLLTALLLTATPKLDAAIDLYQSGEYSKALAALMPLVQDTDLALPQRARALAYLAAAQVGAKDLEAAKLSLRRLAKEFPDYRLSAMEFMPEIISLAGDARAELEKETAAAAKPEPAKPDSPPNTPTAAAPAAPAAPEVERSVRVRLGAFGFSEPMAKTIGAGASAGVSISGLDLSARLLLGNHVGFGAEVGYRFLDGRLLQPRLSARFSGIPGAGAWGGGAAVGVQFAPIRQLWIGAEVGAEIFAVGKGYRPLAIPVALGVGALL